MSEKSKVVICVSGGCVSAVHVDDKDDIEVIVFDFDEYDQGYVPFGEEITDADGKTQEEAEEEYEDLIEDMDGVY